jgi:hypothetical protein
MQLYRRYERHTKRHSLGISGLLFTRTVRYLIIGSPFLSVAMVNKLPQAKHSQFQ